MLKVLLDQRVVLGRDLLLELLDLQRERREREGEISERGRKREVISSLSCSICRERGRGRGREGEISKRGRKREMISSLSCSICRERGRGRGRVGAISKRGGSGR